MSWPKLKWSQCHIVTNHPFFEGKNIDFEVYEQPYYFRLEFHCSKLSLENWKNQLDISFGSKCSGVGWWVHSSSMHCHLSSPALTISQSYCISPNPIQKNSLSSYPSLLLPQSSLISISQYNSSLPYLTPPQSSPVSLYPTIVFTYLPLSHYCSLPLPPFVSKPQTSMISFSHYTICRLPLRISSIHSLIIFPFLFFLRTLC